MKPIRQVSWFVLKRQELNSYNMYLKKKYGSRRRPELMLIGSDLQEGPVSLRARTHQLYSWNLYFTGNERSSMILVPRIVYRLLQRM